MPPFTTERHSKIPAVESNTQIDPNLIFILAFISGACSLLVEIAGARAFYPYLGNTIFTWAGNIAVVLGFLTLGYWYGGRSADRNKSPAQLANFMFLAALATAVVPWLAFAFGPLAMALPIQIASILLPLILAPASFFYGTFCPYAIKLSSKGGQEGSGSGNIFSISTFGSIVGVLVTAFIMVPNMELRDVFLLASLVMAASSFVLYRERIRYIDALMLVFILVFSLMFNLNPHFGDIVYQKNSPYALITVTDMEFSGKPSRIMMLDNAFSSGEADGLPVFRYMYMTAYSFDLVKDPSRALVLGTAAGNQVEQLKRQYPLLHVDTVDIDPDAVETGIRFFSLQEDNRTDIIIDDARRFISLSNKTYDLIIVDTFRSNSPPPHLATVEFVRSLKSRTRPGSVIAVNLIARLEKGGGYLQYVYDTYRSQFKNVYLFPSGDEGERQNVVLIATDEDDLGFEEKYADKIYPMQYDPQKILTDSKNPVELLSAG